MLARLFMTVNVVAACLSSIPVGAQDVDSGPRRTLPFPGDFDAALIKATHDVDRNPRSPNVYYSRGLIFAAKNEPYKAITDYSEAIRLAPEAPDPFRERAIMWRMVGDPDRSNRDFDDAIRIYSQLLISETDRDKQMRWFRYVERSEVWLTRGDRGDCERALADLNELIRLNPQKSIGFIRRGALREFQGDLEQAMADFSEAIKVEPKSSSAYYCRGCLCSRNGNLDRAMIDLNEALRLLPSDPAAHVARGDVFEKRREFDKALADYDEAIRIWPLLASAYAHRGHAWMEKEELDKALADFNEVARLKPSDVTTYIRRGAIWQSKAEFEKARIDYDTAARVALSAVSVYRSPKYTSAPAHDEVAKLRATNSEARFRHAKAAIEHATKACELSEWKNDAFIATLSAAFAEAGQFDEAKKRLQQAIDMAPKKDVETRAKMMTLFSEGKPYHEELKAK